MTEVTHAPPTLSIVVPVFNEAVTIGKLVEQVHDALVNISYEIVLVDDRSTDGSRVIVEQLAAGDAVSALFHAKNQGKGAALRSALSVAQGEIIIIQDANLEYDPRDIPRLIQPILDDRADVVYGSRFHGAA